VKTAIQDSKRRAQQRKQHLFRFLSILSIKRGNWFYWADRAETAERAEIKESPLFMAICSYVAHYQRLAKIWDGRIPSSAPDLFVISDLN